MNGRDNVETVEGDLYAPVRGLTFDRIVTQPPYIAAETDKITYRDGGKDGEQIFRRIVEGLPRFLRPGGTCYALLMATDREGEAFEQRIRRWLGESAGEFDIAMVCDVAQDPVEFLRNAQKIAREEKEYRRILYRETKTSAVLYGSVAIRRKLEPGPPVVAARTFAGKTLSGNDLDFLLKWTAAVAAPGGTEISGMRARRWGRIANWWSIHRVRDGRLAGRGFRIAHRWSVCFKREDARLGGGDCDGMRWNAHLGRALRETASRRRHTPRRNAGRVHPHAGNSCFYWRFKSLITNDMAFHGGEW